MSNKIRIESCSLVIRLSFGCAKMGMEFKSQDEIDEYTTILEGAGECLLYSHNKDSCSPYVRRFGSTKRNKNWSKPTQITKLISNMYQSDGCMMHYAFLREHSNSFFRIISASIAHLKDASPFIPFVEDPSSVPSDAIIDEHLLSVFVSSFKNDILGQYLPETDKYPPTNESMLKVPPTLREWKKESNNLMTIITPTEACPKLKQRCVTNVQYDEVIVLTFQNVENNKEISVCIESPLSMASTIASVMDLGGVNKDFGLSNFNTDENLSTPMSSASAVETLKFRVLKQNESFYTFCCDKLPIMTVSTLVRMKNIHDDYLIVV